MRCPPMGGEPEGMRFPDGRAVVHRKEDETLRRSKNGQSDPQGGRTGSGSDVHSSGG